MKLLIVTQAVDENDPVLGFFCAWITEFAKHFERITVIGLSVGKYRFPENVSVYSLGKEKGRQGRHVYASRFLSLAWKLRNEYDAVFVHMNQEYVLLTAWLWKLLGKRIYLWRNHYAGSLATDIAAVLSRKVFFTSEHSYTAKFKNAEKMPVGVDVERFHSGGEERIPRSLLFLSRMAPSKRPEMLVEALDILKEQKIDFHADFVGSPLPKDASWYENLKAGAASLGASVTFRSGVSNAEAAELFRSHIVFINCSPSGMLDKTIFEAAASGCHVLTASSDFAALAGRETYFDSSEQLAEKLKITLGQGTEHPLDVLVRQHSLHTLAAALSATIGHFDA